jgi:hypothetical protein
MKLRPFVSNILDFPSSGPARGVGNSAGGGWCETLEEHQREIAGLSPSNQQRYCVSSAGARAQPGA